MTRTVRSRRAESANQPLYARALRLRHLAPSGLLCFVFLEGAIVLGILLALAELVSWWGVLVLPASVALMVKFNDLVTGSLMQQQVATETASARATVLRPAAMPAAPEHHATPGSASGATFSAGSAYGYGPATSAPAYGYQGSTESATGYARSAESTTGFARSTESATGYARSDNGSMPSGYGTGNPAPMPATAGYAHAGQTADDPGFRASGAGLPATGGAQVRRQWAEQMDVRQQMARQSAVRRYE